MGMEANVKRERIIAEYDGRGWLVMFPDGEVKGYATEDDALASIKYRLEKHIKSVGADVLLTEVEWRR